MERIDRLVQQSSHHEGMINALSQRMGHVETKLDAHDGKLDTIIHAVSKHENRPSFDFHKTISSITQIAVLFSMVVGGIIFITTSQFSPMVQVVNRNEERVKKIESDIGDVKDKVGWIARVENEGKKR
ncbi:MAG: hypothetical protein AB7U76_25025 [Pirellulales bacterium]